MTNLERAFLALLTVGAVGGCGGALAEPTAEVRQGEIQVLVATADATLDEAGPHPTVRPNCLVRGDETKVGFACLIRFAIPEMDAKVSRAWLELRVLNESPETVGVYPALENWSEDHATWTNRTLDKQWQEGGAKGSQDRGPSLGELSAKERGDTQFVFDAAGLALVQGWLDEPSTHRGIVIASDTSRDGIGIASREHPKAAYRPKLFLQFGGEGG